MKINKNRLQRIIQEELAAIRERVKPETMVIDPESDEFTVMAEPDRPGEFGGEREIKGRIEKYGGRYLPKAVKGEEYFNPDYTPRQVSGMLSSQLRDLLNQQMGDLGYDAAAIQAAGKKISKGEVVADNLLSRVS